MQNIKAGGMPARSGDGMKCLARPSQNWPRSSITSEKSRALIESAIASDAAGENAAANFRPNG
jgi:hypothetical protein